MLRRPIEAARADTGMSSRHDIWGNRTDVYVDGAGTSDTMIVSSTRVDCSTVVDGPCNGSIVGEPAGGFRLGSSFRKLPMWNRSKR